MQLSKEYEHKPSEVNNKKYFTKASLLKLVNADYAKKFWKKKFIIKKDLLKSYLKAAGLFKYVWPFRGHQALKG